MIQMLARWAIVVLVHRRAVVDMFQQALGLFLCGLDGGLDRSWSEMVAMNSRLTVMPIGMISEKDRMTIMIVMDGYDHHNNMCIFIPL